MKTYISKPIEVKAELFNPDRIEEYRKMGAEIEIVPTAFGKTYILPTLESENGRGKVYITEDFYLVCGTKGEFYPCRKDIFEEKYFSKEPMEKEDKEIKKLKEEIEDKKKMIKYFEESDKKYGTNTDLSYNYSELCRLYAEYVEFLVSILKD